MDRQSRWKEPPERIDIYGWRGKCRYCVDGEVVVSRHPQTMEVQPDKCHCLLCGQRYFVNVDPDKLDEWERWQWKQKAGRIEFGSGVVGYYMGDNPERERKLVKAREKFVAVYALEKGWPLNPGEWTMTMILEMQSDKRWLEPDIGDA